MQASSSMHNSHKVLLILLTVFAPSLSVEVVVDLAGGGGTAGGFALAGAAFVGSTEQIASILPGEREEGDGGGEKT